MIHGVKVPIFLCTLFSEKPGIKFLNKMSSVAHVHVGFGAQYIYEENKFFV